MNIYMLCSNFEPHRPLLTGADSGNKRQDGGFRFWRGKSVRYGKCKMVGVKLPVFTYGIHIF